MWRVESGRRSPSLHLLLRLVDLLGPLEVIDGERTYVVSRREVQDPAFGDGAGKTGGPEYEA